MIPRLILARLPILTLMSALCCLPCGVTGCSDSDDEAAEITAESEPNDTIIEAMNIPFGRPVLGSVDELNDPDDFFLFRVPISGPYVMSLSGFGASDLDLLLYDRNGFLLDSSAFSRSPEVIRRGLDGDVLYVLQVRAVSTPAATAYTLRVED